MDTRITEVYALIVRALHDARTAQWLGLYPDHESGLSAREAAEYEGPWQALAQVAAAATAECFVRQEAYVDACNSRDDCRIAGADVVSMYALDDCVVAWEAAEREVWSLLCKERECASPKADPQ